MDYKDYSMKAIIILIIAFLPFSSFPNNSIADQICNAYKNTDDRSKCFDELKEEPRYLSFKFGVSACPNKKHWEELIDELDSGIKPKGKGIDKHCLSLREGNIIYGFLNKSYYKGRELAQVKASDGTLLWLESAAIKDVTIDHIKKPEPWHTVLRNQDGKVIN